MKQQDYIITEMDESGEFSVWKEDSPGPPYVVNLNYKKPRCECADWIYRQRFSTGICKHVRMCKERDNV